MLLGSINHVSITVKDIDAAMPFFRSLLEFMGYTVGSEVHEHAGTRVIVNLNERNGVAFNIWQAKPGLSEHPFEVYEIGLHHVAFNAAYHHQVDELAKLIPQIGGEILEGPGEYPFGPGGYYALYFLGPDRLKFEFVHMPLAEQRARALGHL
ncbi:MAG TPA: VOC family protein [Candidatus Binatia bacterium]|nr:VOC family protein [Candidatus Binatia bacterium]